MGCAWRAEDLVPSTCSSSIRLDSQIDNEFVVTWLSLFTRVAQGFSISLTVSRTIRAASGRSGCQLLHASRVDHRDLFLEPSTDIRTNMLRAKVPEYGIPKA